MEAYTVTTDLGTIQITKNALAKIIVDAIDEFKGRVLLSDHKGRIVPFVQKKGTVDGNPNMEVNFNEDGIDIRIYVVIRFGTSITATTNKLIEEIHRRIQKLTGEAPKSVAIVVAGTISKNIKRRNIEVRRQYDHE